MNRLKQTFGKLKQWFLYIVSKRYIYGKISNGVKCRKCKITNKVEMLLWKKGEQGHKKDFYRKVGYGWEKTFNAY